MLILLNGPPARGKSTLAAHFVDHRQMALNLDLDGKVATGLNVPRSSLCWAAGVVLQKNSAR